MTLGSSKPKPEPDPGKASILGPLGDLLDRARIDLEIPFKIFEQHSINKVLLILGTSRECPSSHLYTPAACELAERVSAWSLKQPPEKKWWICSGGKGGIMSAASEGASSNGSHPLGFGFDLQDRPPNAHQRENFTHQFSALGLRDYWMFSRAKAIVAFPGGLGTLMELFDALLHIQIGLRPEVPVFLFGTEFWSKVVDFQILLDGGLVSKHELRGLRFCDSPDPILDSLEIG